MRLKLFTCLFTFSTLAGSVTGQTPLPIPPVIDGGNYTLNLQQGTNQFYSGITTNTLGANGDLLGPTLIMHKDSFVNIDVVNQIGEETTIHWHGMHVSPPNDGGPHTVIDTGATWSPSFTVMDKAGLCWYHPHLHMQTDKHVSKGIAGLIIVKDAEEEALILPRTYGQDDFPIILQTKGFDASGQIEVHTELDTSVMVNGTVNAYLDVPAQVVRLRVLNGSSQRNMQIGFSGNQAFQIIGTDGGLLEAPVSLTRYRVGPGQRADILIDLAGMQGQSFSLMSFASELPNGFYGALQEGMGPGPQIPGYDLNPLNGSDFSFMEFNVVAQTASPVTSIPVTLVPHTPLLEANANATRSLTFTSTQHVIGPFLINGASFDMNVINYTIPLNNIEVWSLTNQSPIAHPFHIHDVQFYILDINGSAPPVEMQGLNDVVLVPPMQTVRFIAQFSDHSNDSIPYMYHCHMLTHEDEGMMGQFLVVDPTGVDEPTGFEGSINVFPNPSDQGDFSVDLSGLLQEATHYELYSIDGTLIGGEAVNLSRFDVKINGAAGVYLLKMYTKSGVLSKKLIVEK